MDQSPENLSDRIFIRLAPSTTRELAAVAAEERRVKSEIARHAIEHYLHVRRIEKARRDADRALLELSR